VFLDILVAYDGTPSSTVALGHAVDLARAQNSKLTIIAVAPPVTRYAAAAGVSPQELRDTTERWARERIAEAMATVPDDVIAHSVVRVGRAGEEIVKELERGTYDLIVLGSRGHGRVGSNLLGSVNGFVHFHSKVALLSIGESGS
jgi:nucleotide-binding universal stress UspA family protein